MIGIPCFMETVNAQSLGEQELLGSSFPRRWVIKRGSSITPDKLALLQSSLHHTVWDYTPRDSWRDEANRITKNPGLHARRPGFWSCLCSFRVWPGAGHLASLSLLHRYSVVGEQRHLNDEQKGENEKMIVSAKSETEETVELQEFMKQGALRLR